MSTRTRAVVHDVLPALLPEVFPGCGEKSPLEIPALSAKVAGELVGLLTSGGFDAWSQALAGVGNCARPIRLRGRSETIDVTTGEVVSTYCSEQEPLGVTHVPCGNRRASECPSCSRRYAADMFQLIRAGVAGGKTVPAAVAENPLVCSPRSPHPHSAMFTGVAMAVAAAGPTRAARRCVSTADRGPATSGTPT